MESHHRFPTSLLVVALAIVACVRALPYLFFSPDDFYIYLRFVTNVVERGEFSFNAGSPTYGFTSSLWLVFLAGIGKLSGHALWGGKLLSLLTTLLSPLLVFAILHRLTGERSLAWLAGLVWAGNAWLVRWSASGLEAGFSATLALAVVWFSMRAREDDRLPWLAALCAGAAPFIRPEMIGLSILFVLAWALFERRWKRLLVTASIPALMLIVGGSALYAEFGRFLPNTAEAKGSMVDGFAKLIPSLTRILKIVASTSAIELVLIAVGLVVWLTRGQWRRFAPRQDLQFVLLMVAWSVGVVALYGVRGVNVYTRYLLIFMPFVVIGGFAVLAPWWRRGGGWRAAVLLIGTAILVQNVALDLRLVRPATAAYQESERRVNVVIGEWLRDHTAPEAVVAVPDIGAIGYISRREILDLNGLVTPELIPYKRNKEVNRFLEENPPDFIISIHEDPNWLDKNGPDLRLTQLLSLPFEKMFIFQKEPLYYSLYRVEGPAAPEGPALAMLTR
jgi:hypothetical protein